MKKDKAKEKQKKVILSNNCKKVLYNNMYYKLMKFFVYKKYWIQFQKNYLQKHRRIKVDTSKSAEQKPGRLYALRVDKKVDHQTTL